MKLYELANMYNRIIEMEESEAMLDTLESIEESLDQKAENIAKMITELNAQSETISVEIKRLTEMKSKIENKSNYLQNYIYDNMVFMKKDTIKSDLFNIKIVKNPYSVEIKDEAIIPEDYKNQKITISVDKKKLLEDLKNGMEIQGATLQQKTRLSIK
jgi:DNA repair ATPase RecN